MMTLMVRLTDKKDPDRYGDRQECGSGKNDREEEGRRVGERNEVQKPTSIRGKSIICAEPHHYKLLLLEIECLKDVGGACALCCIGAFILKNWKNIQSSEPLPSSREYESIQSQLHRHLTISWPTGLFHAQVFCVGTNLRTGNAINKQSTPAVQGRDAKGRLSGARPSNVALDPSSRPLVVPFVREKAGLAGCCRRKGPIGNKPDGVVCRRSRSGDPATSEDGRSCKLGI
ncbi:hypothetical protein B0T17DRAFT_504915 [Bombardia bombarda]|uniref:Uncharacterized protein n=1 Tax=Bombardia bombarda TaxID=252184 RepID=A0AA39X6J9_9PEZI|nr:hypothetical protein B0T17DRAFT_504915 [Bombardia bombarda]